MSISYFNSPVITLLKDRISLLDEKLTEKFFFLELSDYVKFIQQLDFFSNVEKGLKKDKKDDEKEVNKLGKMLLIDSENVRSKLVKELNDKKIPLNHLNNEFFEKIYVSQKPGYDANEHYQRYKDNKWWMSGDRVENLYSMVGHMLNGLHFHGHRDIVKPFVEFTKGNDGNEYINKWKISEKIDYYRREVDILKTKAITAPWSVYEHLILVPFTLYEWPKYRDQLVKKFEKGKVSFMEVSSLDSLVSEMKEVMEERKGLKIEFKRDVYLFYVKSFNLFLSEYIYKLGLRRDVVVTPKTLNIKLSEPKNILSKQFSWPSEFKWNNDKTRFILGNEEKYLSFDPKESARKKVFEALLDKQGDWAEVRWISNKTDIEDEDLVRKIINQLIKEKIERNKLSMYIYIEPRWDEIGAYRLVPNPTKKILQQIIYKRTGKDITL